MADSAFVRELESAYDALVAEARAAGLIDEAAHARAFEAVKHAGNTALDELRRTGRTFHDAQGASGAGAPLESVSADAGPTPLHQAAVMHTTEE